MSNAASNTELPAPSLVTTSSLNQLEGACGVLALASSECYSFVYSADEYSKFTRGDRLRYQIEDEVAADAEDLVLASKRVGVTWIVIAFDSKMWQQPIQDVIEGKGSLLGICPMVMLAIGELQQRESLESIDLVLWSSEEGIDAIRLESGLPSRWELLPHSSEDVLDAIRRCTEESLRPEESSVAHVLAIDFEKDFLAGLLPEDDQLRSFKLTTLDLDRELAASLEASRVLNGSVAVEFDLRQGPLAFSWTSGRLRAAQMAIALSVLFVLGLSIAGVHLKTRQYSLAIDNLVAGQQKAYRQAFGNQPIPVGIAARLESVERRLKGTRSLTSDDIAESESVVPVFASWLAAMPVLPQERYRINRLDLSPRRIEAMEGECTSLDALETIANALSASRFDVPPVSVNRTNRGIAISLLKVDWTVDSEARGKESEKPRGTDSLQVSNDRGPWQ